MSKIDTTSNHTIEDGFDSHGQVEGLFQEMAGLFPDMDLSNMRFEDGYYVTHKDEVIAISDPRIYRLTRDLDGLLCWVVDMSYLDNWYEGPYFSMAPLSEELVGEIRLSERNMRKSWELKPEKDPADDQFLKLRARVSDEDGRYLDAVFDGARAEIALWKAEPWFSRDVASKTGTAVGELDAIRRLGKMHVRGDCEYGKAPVRWLIARQGEYPSMHSLMIVLIGYLENGWVPEVFLQECGIADYAWDVAAMREFLDFARRAYGREIPDLHHVELMDGVEEGDHSQSSFFKDLETGRTWRYTCTWTPYYSDGLTFHRPSPVAK